MHDFFSATYIKQKYKKVKRNGDCMLKEVEILIALVLLLLGILLVFNARVIVRIKMDNGNENIKVNIIKWLGAFLAAIALIFIYYIK